MSEGYLITDKGIDQGQQTIDDITIPKTTKLSPFDFINAINNSKRDLFVDDNGVFVDHSDSEYVKFIINRQFSYFADTIMFANAANINLNNVPNHSHFDFYRFGIPRSKRFCKWSKKTITDQVTMIAKYYNVSLEKAEQYIKILSKDQIETITRITDHGGTK